MSVRRPQSLPGLAKIITGCTQCPRLRAHCLEIARTGKKEFAGWHYWGKPVPGFGDPNAQVLIVGLAPAAHGANRTGRVFTGDSSGNWLYEALHRFGFANQPTSVSRDDGLTLQDCYIAAAVRCAPPQNKPTAAEMATCRPYLEDEIRLVPSARVTITLGRIGHESWLRAAGWWSALPPRQRPAFGHGAEGTLPDGTVVLSSFHPSRQNTNTGRLTRRMWYAVFRRARTLVDEAAATVRD